MEGKERTFVIPRRIQDDWATKKKHYLLAGPWWAAAALMFYFGDRLGLNHFTRVWVPPFIAAAAWFLFGWQGGEDDHTTWEMFLRWRKHTNTQAIYLYQRKE